MNPDWIRVTPVEDRDDNIEGRAMDKLAARIQARVKSTVDHGVSKDAALTGGSIVAQSSGGRIVIKSDNAAEVLRQSSRSATGESSGGDGDNPDSLFEQSSGVPKLVSDGSGERLLFRSISAESIMRRQAVNARDESVQRAVADSVRMGLTKDFDEAITDSRRGQPK